MMYKKNILLILFSSLSLFFGVNALASGICVDSDCSLYEKYSVTTTAIGSVALSYFCYCTFFGSSFMLGGCVEKSKNEGPIFQDNELLPEEKVSRLRSMLSMLSKGVLIGVTIVVSMGLLGAVQNGGAQMAEAQPGLLMLGAIEDVDLAKYIKKPEDISETFDDLIALPPSLQAIINDVRKGGTPPKGMLFFGEPGAGKSHSSKALAKACDALLFRIPGYEFTGSGVDFSRRLFKLIDRAKKENASNSKNSHIFLVIDEAEVFGIRSKLGFSETQLDLGGSIRALMDYTEQKDSGVTCIFTTNHPELIDCALKRPGRIGEHIEFKIPDKKERCSIVELHAKKKNVSFSVDALQEIIANSEGWTGDYLAKCVEKCGRGSSGSTVQIKKAKEAVLELGELWSSNQEKRRAQSGSRWMRLLKSGTSSAVSAVTGNIGLAVSHGVDAVGSLFE